MSFPSLVVEGVGDSGDINSGMSMALRNPLILDGIFANLDLADLKNSRLVCRVWSDVGATALSKRTFLRALKMVSYEGSKFSVIPPVHEKLLRRLSFNYNSEAFDPSVPPRKTSEVSTRIFTCVPHLSQLTREIDLLVNERKYANAFLDGVRRLKSSSNIRHISIGIEWTGSSAGKGEYKVRRKIPPQNNLTSIWFVVYGDVPKFGFHAFQPLLQALMDAAPNLTFLDVTPTFYPNLEGCTNLKILKFCVVKSTPPTFFDVAAGMKMLGQVKDSLRNLCMRYYGEVELVKLPELAQDLEVPVMSKLVSLLICQSPVYLFEDFYNQDRLPSLKHLTLQIDVEAWKLSTYLSLWKRHDGVTSLVLTLDRIWWMRDTFSERIAHLFPSMKKLELTIILPRAEITQEINRLLEPFKIWDLKEVDVLAKSVVASSSIVAVLRNMSMWKGVRRVHFKETYVTQADFTPCIQDLVLYSGGFESVKITGYNFEPRVPEILDTVQPIFDGAGVPIQLIGGVIRDDDDD